ncbi:MAG: tetratricopeptide repeat protein, partial [Flavobacteriales bacterium]
MASLIIASCGSHKHVSKSNPKGGGEMDPAYQDMFFNAQLEKVRGNAAQAYNLFLNCVNMDPTISASFYELSVLNLSMGKPRESKEYAEACIAREPENPWYHRQFGNACMEMGEYAKAIKSFTKVCELKLNDLDACYDLAGAQLFANQFEDVVKTYDIIEGMTGVYEDLSLQKHAIYRDQLKNPDQAANELLRLVKAYPGEMSFVSLAVEYLRTLGRQDEAMQLIQEAQRFNPNDGRMQFQLSEYYAQKGDDATSFEHLKLAFASADFPIDQRIALLLKFYNLSENNALAKERAYTLLIISQSVFPKEPKLLAMSGDYYARDMRLVEAIEQYRQALEIDPTRHPIWMQTLALEMETHDFSSMAVDAARALEYYPTTADFYYYLGYAHFRLHQYAQAVEDFETGKELVVDDMKLLIRFYERLGLSL